jgi:hypothetical protein
MPAAGCRWSFRFAVSPVKDIQSNTGLLILQLPVSTATLVNIHGLLFRSRALSKDNQARWPCFAVCLSVFNLNLRLWHCQPSSLPASLLMATALVLSCAAKHCQVWCYVLEHTIDSSDPPQIFGIIQAVMVTQTQVITSEKI